MAAATDAEWLTLELATWQLGEDASEPPAGDGSSAAVSGQDSGGGKELLVPLVGSKAYRETNIAASVWVSGVILARVLLSAPDACFAGVQHALELGCGAAAAPAVAAARRLPSTAGVTASDANEEALAHVAAGVQRNGVPGVVPAVLKWGALPPPDCRPPAAQLLLGGDVMYIGSVIKTLLGAVVELLDAEHGVFLLVDPGRDYNLEALQDAAVDVGLATVAHVVLTAVAAGPAVAKRVNVFAFALAPHSELATAWAAALQRLQDVHTVAGGEGGEAPVCAYVLG